MAKITIQNLCKQYKNGEVQALKDISLECRDGGFFCLLGPAGAGKTTTIKLLAGIEAADSGRILLDDVDITDQMPMHRDLAVAFETYALYPQRTVRQNLAFPLQSPLRKNEWTPETMEQRVVEIANLLGIGELLDRLPRQLSGGQRQRVALGRALVRKPKAYLLDEPIAHLDAKLRHRMRGELKRIQMELGITTIYTTPDQLEALSLADTMAVINNGRIEQSGTPAEIYRRPANVFVARFVGDPPMNILTTHLVGDELALNSLMRLKLSEPFRRALSGYPPEKPVLLGIRPKDMRLTPPDAPQAKLHAESGHIQVLGETSVVTLSSDGLEIRLKLATQQAPRRGERVGVDFSIEDCHLFDAHSQTRIATEND